MESNHVPAGLRLNNCYYDHVRHRISALKFNDPPDLDNSNWTTLSWTEPNMIAFIREFSVEHKKSR
jgi:hypothetical protein